jgi:ATP-dependent RNA helicase DHX57
LTILNAYNAWREAKNNGKNFEKDFCRDNFLSMKGLYGIAEQRTQFVKLLREAGFLNEQRKKTTTTKQKKKVATVEKTGSNGGGIPKPRGGVPVFVNEDNEDDEEDEDEEKKPAWESANRHATNVRLLKACLVAGLYPNVSRVESVNMNVQSSGNRGRSNTTSNIVSGSSQPPPKLKYLAEDTGKEAPIQIHPSSINAKAKQFPTRWLVYHERVQTASIFMRDCTSVTPYQLLLFGGKIDVQHSAGTIRMDGWATFEANARIGVLLKEIRAALDGLLREKIENPEAEENARGETIVTTILQLLNSEAASSL